MTYVQEKLSEVREQNNIERKWTSTKNAIIAAAEMKIGKRNKKQKKRLVGLWMWGIDRRREAGWDWTCEKNATEELKLTIII